MTTINRIAVKHNIEVAHRLFELPGKCEQIHGHSMWVTMHLEGEVNRQGILGGIEYSDLKKVFRGHLDYTYDHRLLLNRQDPFARPIFYMDRNDEGQLVVNDNQVFLPGLQTTEGDPTTENLARWIGEEMISLLTESGYAANLYSIQVQVWETSVNMASWERGLA